MVSPVRQTLEDLYVSVLDKVYAIPPEQQTQEMRDLLREVNDRLDEVSGIGRYRGGRPIRNATAIINALKTRIILTLGPQVQRSQKAVVQQGHQEVVIRHVDAAGGLVGKPN